MKVALDLLPETRLVAIVGGASPSDRRNAAFGRRLVAARAPGLDVLSLAGLPLDEQLQRVATLPDHSLVLFTSYRADPQGRSMVARDVLRLVARAANAPTFGAADVWLGYGIVGGDLIRYRGARAAGCGADGSHPQRGVSVIARTGRCAGVGPDVRLA